MGNNYRPATFTGTATTASGYLNVVQVNVKHPSTQDAANTELTTYWAISTSGMSDISVTHQYTYVDGDVQSDENLYVTGRFDQDVLDWSPGLGGEAGTSVTPASNLLTWTTKTYLDGDYTAGYTDEFEALAIYYSRNSTSGGNWSDPNSWSTDPVLQHDGAPALVAPNGNQLFIASGHTITIDGHSKRGSIVNLLGTLDCQAFIGHIFKEIEGTGVLSLNATGGGSFVLPTAIITDFVSATGGTVRFAGTNNGSLPAAQTQYNEMVFDGAFTKTLPPVNLTVLGDITIENTVGNVVNHPSNTLTLYGNWTNNRGASGYTSAAGTINMINSTAVRDITGVTTFRNLTINNTFATAPQVTVNSPITVQGTLTLTSGVVQTDAVNIITLANGATTGIGSASAYIDGPMAVTKASVGVTNFNFPIGKLDEYRPAQLSVTHSDVASTIYTAEMLPGNANDLGYTLPGTLEHVSYTRFWDISKTGAGTVTGATVRLYYSSTGTNDEVFDAPNLAVAKTNDLYTDWVDLNGTATGNNNGSILSGSFTTFSLFTLANKVGGGNPLPVDLLYVKAKKQENNVLVQWATASEINQSHFEIERSSDGKNFNYIGAVYSSQSHSSQLKSYDFIDQNPQTGINYYRLKQVDLDGQFIYSNMVYVIYDDISSFKHNNFFTLYPNPVKHDQLIHVQSTNTNQSIKEVTVMLVDIHGKAYLTDVLLTDIDGGFYYAISIDKTIPPGTYMIIASTSEMYEAQKIIIQ